MPALFRLLAGFPLPLLHRIGWALGWLVYAASPTYRRRFRENARTAGLTPAQVRPAIGAAGAMAAELPWLWLRPHDVSALPRICHWHGAELLEAALAERRGVITLTPHLGSWEMIGQAVGERFAQHGPLTALFRPARKAWMRPFVAGARDRPGLRTFPTTLAGVRSLMRVLRAGGYIGLLPDQVPPQGQGVWAAFFGKPAYTMTLVARLAQQSGAKVFICVCKRLPRGAGYAITIEPVDTTVMGNVKASAEAQAEAMNRAIEAVVLRLPGQYLWGYGRYKTPRTEAPPAGSTPGSVAPGEYVADANEAAP